jgi:GNAT superfamily N-acetyltransferase
MRDLRCDEFVEQVTDFLDGVLNTASVERFSHHLATCPGCAPYLDQIRRTIRAVSGTSVSPRTRSGRRLQRIVRGGKHESFRGGHIAGINERLELPGSVAVSGAPPWTRETHRVTTDFIVRQALPADAPSLAQLRWVFKQDDDDFREAPPSAAQFLYQAEVWIGDRLTDGRWLAWVAETADAICGHVFLQPVERMPDPQNGNAPIGYVTNFYIDPGQRNRGIGAALLQELAEFARARAFDTLIVWPSELSATLYQRAGFHTPDELLELPLDI